MLKVYDCCFFMCISCDFYMCYLHYPAVMFINIAKLRLEKYGNYYK